MRIALSQAGLSALSADQSRATVRAGIRQAADGGGGEGGGAGLKGGLFIDSGVAMELGDQSIDVVALGQVDGQEDALVVVGGEDQVLRAVDGVAIFLGLVAGDDDVGLDLLGEQGDAAGGDVAAPDELIDRAGPAGVVGAGQFAIEDGVVEGLDLRSRWAGCGSRRCRCGRGRPAAARAGTP